MNYFTIERVTEFNSRSRNTFGQICHIRFNPLEDQQRPDLAMTVLISHLLDRVLAGRPAPLRVGLQVQPPNFQHAFTIPLRPLDQNNPAALAAAIERLNEISAAGIDLLSGTTVTKVVGVWPLNAQRTNNPDARSGRSILVLYFLFKYKAAIFLQEVVIWKSTMFYRPVADRLCAFTIQTTDTALLVQ